MGVSNRANFGSKYCSARSRPEKILQESRQRVMFESNVHNRIGLASRSLRNCVLRLRQATSRISSTAARNLAVTVLMGCAFAAGQTLTTLYNFGSNPHDGADPLAGVVFDN